MLTVGGESVIIGVESEKMELRMKNVFMVVVAAALATLTGFAGDVIERRTFDADRTSVRFPEHVKDNQKNDFSRVYGWAEFDVEIASENWYELSETWSENAKRGLSNIYIDGQPFKMAYSPYIERNRLLPPQVNRWNPRLKECNVFLTKGKHTLRFERTHFAGGLSLGWRLAEATNAQQTLRAKLDATAFHSKTPVKLTVTGGFKKMPTRYDLLFVDAVTDRTNHVGQIDFPRTERPITKDVMITIPRQTEVGYLLAQSKGELARPADLGLTALTVIDRVPADVPQNELKLTLVADIDCVKTPPYREKDGVTRIVARPFGAYRELVPTNLPYKTDWALDAFSYAIAIPDADHVYKLVVDYPDDDFRSVGFWTSDQTRNHFEGKCLTGGIETGIEYRNTHTMLKHEAFFHPQKTNLIFAAVNLNVGSRAAASRIRIYRVEGPLPRADITTRRGRLFGNGFEEFGRWKWHFGMRAGGNRDYENIRSMERWLEWNRFAGANFIMPTISAYNFTEYPSLEQKGTGVNSPMLNQPRILALLANKYGNKFMPHIQVEYQGDCVGVSNGVNVVYKEKRDAHNRPVVARIEILNADAEGYVLVDRNGNRHCAKSPMEPFIFNPLHPRVQEKYIRMVGEVADLIGDTESFLGISLRVPFGWHFTGWNGFHGLEYGYEDWTIREFEKDTGIRVPGAADDPKRFMERYRFLVYQHKNTWMTWRQKRMHDYYTRILARVRAVKPDAMLQFAFWGHFADLPARGIDLEPFRDDMRFSFTTTDSGQSYGHQHFTLLDNAKRNDRATNPDAFKSTAYGFRSTTFGGGYYEPNSLFDWTQVGGTPYGAFDQCRPGGVNELQNFAVAMKRCDPCLINNFGSGWMFGTPAVEVPFLREYQALPTARFADSAAAKDPIVLRELRTDTGLWIYALNMLDTPVQARLKLAHAGKVTSAVTGREESTDFTLGAYGLKGFFVENQTRGLLARLLRRPPEKATIAGLDVSHDRKLYDVYYQAAAFTASLREPLARRQILADATARDVADYLRAIDAVVDAAAKGRTAALKEALYGFHMTYVFAAIGKFPAGLNHAARHIGGYPATSAKFRAPRFEKILGGDPRAKSRTTMTYLETSNRVYAVGLVSKENRSPRVVEFDTAGNYVRTPRLTSKGGLDYLMGGLTASSNNKIFMPNAVKSFTYEHQATIREGRLVVKTVGDYAKTYDLRDFREGDAVPKVNVQFPKADTKDRGLLTHPENPLVAGTQLVAHDGKVWFLGNGKLKCIDPKTDAITDVVDFSQDKTAREAKAFAFTPEGDLVISNTAKGGVRLFRARRTARAFGAFEELTDQPLAPWYTAQTDLIALADGRVVVRTGTLDRHDFSAFKDGKSEPFFSLGWTRRHNSHRWGAVKCRDGAYVVAGGGSHTVTKFNPDWTIRWQRKANKAETMDSLSLATVVSVAEDARGNLWIVDAGREHLVCLDGDGNFLGTYGHSGTIDDRSGAGFAEPTGIAIVGDALYVADSGNQRIVKLILSPFL